MKKEKVMHVKLPEGAKYQKVEVTADGEIAIHYVEECNENNEAIMPTQTILKVTQKPIPLIGGTEVYQKDNGTNYWYCKIKNRDEFMYLYFADLSKEDLLYDVNGNRRKFATSRQKIFKENVLMALGNMPEEGFRWIPVYEPSMDYGDNLQYVSGANVLRTLAISQWEEIFKNYSPENGSKMATITTYFLLLLRWLKDGQATVEQLADDSKEIGHYWDSENAKHEPEKTGEGQFGGVYDFLGNTSKIVKNSASSSGFSLLGGNYYYLRKVCSLADIATDSNSPLVTIAHGVALLELTK